MVRFIVLFCAVLAGAYAQARNVESCSSGGDLPFIADIKGCTSKPCLVSQNQDLVFDVVFIAPRSLRSLRTLATVYIGGLAANIPIPFDLGERSNTCNYLNNSQCPVDQGELVSYSPRLPVSNNFPVGLLASVELKVVDENTNSPIFCVRAPVQIV